MDRAILHQLLHDLLLLEGGRWGRECPLGVRLQPLAGPPALFLCPLTHVQTYTGAKAVGWSDLVDVIGMDLVIGAAGSGLALAPPHGPAVHHAAGRRASLGSPLARERVAVVRHHPGGAAGGREGRVSLAFPKALAPCPLSCPHPCCCSPSTSQEPPGAVEMPTLAALLVALVTRQQVLGRQDRCHVPQRMD